jgi:CRP-like cAMP-binding protein
MALEEHGTRREYGSGDLIFAKGEEGSEMYVIESGKVEIVGHSDERDVRLGTLGPDDLFGEMALFGHAPRSATARALEDTTVRAIKQDDIDDLVTDPVARKLIRVLSQRLREVDARLSRLIADGELRREHVMDLFDFRARYG